MIQGLRKRLPVIGKIKIGMATSRGSKSRGAPRKFDHIELTGMQRDAAGALIPDRAALVRALELLEKEGGPGLTCGGCERSDEVAELLKEPRFKKGLPRALDVLLPYNDLELTFPNEMQYFTAGTLWCHGDREQAWRRPKTGQREVKRKDTDGKSITVKLPIFGDEQPHTPCGKACEYYMKPCKPHGRLFLILRAAPSVGACYEFYTTSWNSIENLVNGIGEVAGAAGGLVRGIPLRFEVQKRTLTVQELGVRTDQMIASIRYVGGSQQFEQLALDNLRTRAPVIAETRLLEAQIRRDALPPPDEDEVEHIVTEYHPDQKPTFDVTPIESVPLIDPLAPESVVAAAPDVPEAAEVAHGTEGPAVDEGPSEETFEDGPVDAEPPAEAAAPPAIRDPESEPDRPKIAKGRVTLLTQSAKVQAKALGLTDGDAGRTLLNQVLAAHGIGSVQDVREDEFNALLGAVKRATV